MLKRFFTLGLKRSLSLIIFFVLFNNASANWNAVNAGINENLICVSSYDPYGLIVGQENIYTTITGGKTGASWSLYIPTGVNIDLYKQCKFYSCSQMYTNALVYICGEDTINHTAIIFSISFVDMSLSLEYTGAVGSRLNSISYNYRTLLAAGNNGLLVRQNTSFNDNPDHNFHIVQTNTTQHLNQLYAVNSDTYYIAGDEILISGNISNNIINTVVCPSLKFISIALSNYSSFLMAATATEIYNITAELTYTLSAYDAPGIKPTSICLSQYGEYLTSTTGIYFQKNNTTSLEYQPSSLKANLNYLRFQDNLYQAFGVGPNGLIVYNTDNGGETKPFARMYVRGGCTNQNITYYGSPGGGTYNSWYVNDVNTSSQTTWTTQFPASGQYKIMYVSYNNLYSDTAYQTITIADIPTINLNITLSDDILCKSEQITISIANTQLGYQYQLRRPSDNTSYGTVTSTASTATLLTDFINSTGDYILRVTDPKSTCSVDFTNTLLIKVEHTKARFTPSEINANPNALVTLNNNSYQSAYAKWVITNETDIIHSTDFSPQVRFAIPGNTNVKLVATSENNCSDSVSAAGSFIIEDPANDECWMLHYTPAIKSATFYPYNIYNIRDLKECSDGFLVSGQYFQQDFTSRTGVPYKSHPYGGGYIAKYSRAGLLKWMSYSVDSSLYMEQNPLGSFFSVAESANGNISAIGYNGANTYIFDSTGDSINIQSNIIAGRTYGIILYYAPDGRLLWKKHTNIMPVKVLTDKDNNVIVLGTCTVNDYDLEIGDDNGISKLNLAAHGSGKLILKFNASGTLLWNTFIYDGNENYDIALDSYNNIFISGTAQYSTGFTSANNSPIKNLHTKMQNNFMGYVVKYSPEGNVLWTSMIEDDISYGNLFFNTISVINDSCYITGSIAYNNGTYRIKQPDSTFMYVPLSSAFFIKLSDNGYYQWNSKVDYSGNQFTRGVSFLKTSASNNFITVMGYINSEESGSFISANGLKTTFSNNSAFVFINYDHSGNIRSYQTTALSGTNELSYINEEPTFFYCNANNSIYFSSNLLQNSPYHLLNESFTSGYNFFICKFSSEQCQINIVTDIENNIDLSTNKLVNVFPNPIVESSIISLGNEGITKTIRIMDITGKVVSNAKTADISYPISPMLCNTVAGLYIIQVTCNNEITTSRIIKLE